MVALALLHMKDVKLQESWRRTFIPHGVWVFRKVPGVLWCIQRLWILFIVCYLRVSVDANAASALVDQWRVFKVRVVALCTELYLCIELFFFFSSSLWQQILDSINSSLMGTSSANTTAVAVTSFLFMIDLFQLLLCSLLIVSVLFSRQWLILFFFSLCQTQIFYVELWFVELLPILLSLKQCLENPVQELNFNPCNKTGKCVMFHC